MRPIFSAERPSQDTRGVIYRPSVYAAIGFDNVESLYRSSTTFEYYLDKIRILRPVYRDQKTQKKYYIDVIDQQVFITSKDDLIKLYPPHTLASGESINAGDELIDGSLFVAKNRDYAITQSTNGRLYVQSADKIFPKSGHRFLVNGIEFDTRKNSFYMFFKGKWTLVGLKFFNPLKLGDILKRTGPLDEMGTLSLNGFMFYLKDIPSLYHSVENVLDADGLEYGERSLEHILYNPGTRQFFLDSQFYSIEPSWDLNDEIDRIQGNGGLNFREVFVSFQRNIFEPGTRVLIYSSDGKKMHLEKAVILQIKRNETNDIKNPFYLTYEVRLQNGKTRYFSESEVFLEVAKKGTVLNESHKDVEGFGKIIGYNFSRKEFLIGKKGFLRTIEMDRYLKLVYGKKPEKMTRSSMSRKSASRVWSSCTKNLARILNYVFQ